MKYFRFVLGLMRHSPASVHTPFSPYASAAGMSACTSSPGVIWDTTCSMPTMTCFSPSLNASGLPPFFSVLSKTWPSGRKPVKSMMQKEPILGAQDPSTPSASASGHEPGLVTTYLTPPSVVLMADASTLTSARAGPGASAAAAAAAPANAASRRLNLCVGASAATAAIATNAVKTRIDLELYRIKQAGLSAGESLRFFALLRVQQRYDASNDEHS
mmetsp:Transcript_8883/g.26685  ORF Transcript_8883/g.26685 Transcript_8883/m.26685 type:complete len:216 (-) Transcript_8883:42-689(-)